MELEVDGMTCEVREEGTLLDALREDLGKYCVKDGCAPQGQCGACSVLVDGVPKLSCVTRLSRVAGRPVCTPAGLREPLASRLAAAFVEAGAYVCGFCTPGILVRVHALLSGCAEPSSLERADVVRALSGHLCRCTGWQPVIDAVLAVSRRTEALAVTDCTLPVSGVEQAGTESHGTSDSRKMQEKRENGQSLSSSASSAHAVPLGEHFFLIDRAMREQVSHWVMPVVAGVAGGVFRGFSPLPPEVASACKMLVAGDLSSLPLPVFPLRHLGDTVTDPGDVLALVVASRLSDARVAVEKTRVHIEDPPNPSAPASGTGSLGSDPAAEEGMQWLTTAVDPAFLEPDAAWAKAEDGKLYIRSQTDTPEIALQELGTAFPQREIILEIETRGGSYGGKAGSGPALYAALSSLAFDGAAVCCVFGRREAILWHRRRRPCAVDITLDLEDSHLAGRDLDDLGELGDRGNRSELDGTGRTGPAGRKLRRIDGRMRMKGGSADLGPSPYRVPVVVSVDPLPGRRGGSLRAEGLLQWTFALEQELDRAGVDRGDFLFPLPARCFAAVTDCDGIAIAGNARMAVAVGVRLGARGELVLVRLAYAGGAVTQETQNALLSGAFMGVGTALSEEVPMRAGVPSPATIRSLGMLRPGHTPLFEVIPVDLSSSQDLGNVPENRLDEFALAAVPPALANAVRRLYHEDGFGLPMRGSPPATAIRRR